MSVGFFEVYGAGSVDQDSSIPGAQDQGVEVCSGVRFWENSEFQSPLNSKPETLNQKTLNPNVRLGTFRV